LANDSVTKEQLIDAIADGSFVIKITDMHFDKLSEVGSLLAELHNARLYDIIEYFQSPPWDELSPQCQMRIGRIIGSFSALVRDSTERICIFFHKIHNRAPSGKTYYIDKGLEDWVSANRPLSGELATLIKNAGHDSPFIGPVLAAWRETEPDNALNATIAFSHDNRTEIKRQALFSLGIFRYDDENEASKAEARLADVALSSKDADRISALSAIIRQLEIQDQKSARLLEVVEKLAEEPDYEIRHTLIQGFAFHQGAYSSTIHNRVTSLMKTVGLDSSATLEFIDLALSNMNVDTQRDVVFETISAILSQENRPPGIGVFDALTYKIFNAPHEVIGWYVTRWLLDGDYNICIQIDSIFRSLDDLVYDFKLDSFALNDADIFYLTRKIFAYFMFSHGPAVSLLSACLLAMDRSTRNRLEDEISSFWLRNYPSDLDLFDAVCSNYKLEELKGSIERMRQQVEAYERPLRSLSSNVALKPSTMERRIQAEIAHERNKYIHRTAQETSIFGSLFHTSTLLYGNSSVTYIHASPTEEPVRQVLSLENIHTSMMLPRMDSLYPARLNYLLYRFRRESRPK
jgi:hypothetical protein